LNLKGKKFILLGGAGFIGSHTLDRLLKEDVAKIIIYDDFSRGSYDNIQQALNDPRVSIYEAGGNILQLDILNQALKNVDGLFHFAALWLLQCHDYPRSAFDVNIKGTFNVIEACVKNKVKRLVYSSSASVYGDALYDPMDEDHPYNNKNFYGATKICGEAMLRAFYYRYGLDYVGLRYMNVYGCRQDYKGIYISVIMKMLDAIDQNISPVINGDGSEAFDFISVEDCAEANIQAMKSEHSDCFYNIGTGKKTSLKKLTELLLEMKNSDLSVKYLPSKEKTLVRNRVGDPKKAYEHLGFKSSVILEDGLMSLIKWRDFKKNS